ncbi:von Willebrand factor type A [Isosphaera pallida ATCC 43644]|uniref:von Willebrand factor type A n=1 Tax=Isosphaera pallida (strain ATCC 43644 / DSM 9630 / IS1B) TaxID=575540 RepID=E8QXQ5_ISOPI|nr:VWA domain-containing protein [Isosphaera pallida]ADV64092.1 von Willebrand factor type A [Isosphaera pallida ATCC 43644]
MALHEYSRWDGRQSFSPQSADRLFDQIAQQMLQFGDQVLRRLEDLEDDPDAADLLRKIQEQGLMERDKEGHWVVTPQGLKRVRHHALLNLFQTLKANAAGGNHETRLKGGCESPHEDIRPYVYGDSLAHLNLHETLRNAMARRPSGPPIRLERDDLMIHETERQVRCATVVLIDQSGSMGRYGKYAQTKRIALALAGLVQARFPQDSLEFVGFSSFAHRLSEIDLLNSAPKRVSIFDPRVHLRINLDAPPAFVPQHFTNIHAGLKLARSILARQTAATKQIIVITDGEPTAHVEGRDVLLIYPPCERTADATLAEARQCARAGIAVSSFALIEDSFYVGLVNFVEQLAKVTRGVAISCDASDIGKLVYQSFVGGRQTRRVIP